MTSASRSSPTEQAIDYVSEEADIQQVTVKDQPPDFLDYQQQNDIGSSKVDPEPAKNRDQRKFFHTLRMCFIFLCLFDGIHWAYLLRDDSENSPNVWRFYGKIGEHEHYYLILRIFLDAIVGFLGMGASFWTKKTAFALPCAFVQPLLIFARVFAWSFRNRLPKGYRVEDLGYVVCEFLLPALWLILSIATMVSFSQKSKANRRNIRQPPLIVVSSSRTDNEESVQFEINP